MRKSEIKAKEHQDAALKPKPVKFMTTADLKYDYKFMNILPKEEVKAELKRRGVVV